MDFFSKLPEDCIAKVVSFTSPQDACRISVLGSIFKSAADSDAVWEAFMPFDYKDIIANSAMAPTGSTKELFLRLADTPLIIDQGTKSFSLEKRSGRKCYMLAARDLTIVWSESPEYWKFGSLPESRFPEVAELLNFCWLDITGKISTKALSPNTLYGAYLVFKLTPHESYGFNNVPMEISCEICGEGGTLLIQTETVYLNYGNTRNGKTKMRRDGWMEIKMGDQYFSLININGEDDHNYDILHMSLKEVNHLHRKRGLIVEGIEIRPE